MKKKLIAILRKDAKLTISICIIVVLILYIIISSIFVPGEASVSNEYLETQLQKASDLTTAKLKYTGWTKYTDDGKIPFVTKGGFIMIYDASISAGIDLKEVKVGVNENDKVINLTIPKAEIKDVVVDPSTIQYFDEKFKLLNFSQKEDANEAQELAIKEATEKVTSMGLLEMADEQAEALVTGLLANLATGYKFEVTRTD